MMRDSASDAKQLAVEYGMNLRSRHGDSGNRLPYAERMVQLHLSERLNLPESVITKDVVYAFVAAAGEIAILRIDGIGAASAKQIFSRMNAHEKGGMR